MLEFRINTGYVYKSLFCYFYAVPPEYEKRKPGNKGKKPIDLPYGSPSSTLKSELFLFDLK